MNQEPNLTKSLDRLQSSLNDKYQKVSAQKKMIEDKQAELERLQLDNNCLAVCSQNCAAAEKENRIEIAKVSIFTYVML